MKHKRTNTALSRNVRGFRQKMCAVSGTLLGGAFLALAMTSQASAQGVPFVCEGGYRVAKSLTVGPVDDYNGFPSYFSDIDGNRVELCLDGLGGDIGGICLYDTPVAGNAFSEAIGFGAEAFWWSAEGMISTVTHPNSKVDGLLVLAVEAAFLTEDPADGDQFPFTRLRLRVDVPVAGTYKVVTPYGSKVFDITAATAGQNEINESIDILVNSGTGTSNHNSAIGPLLRKTGELISGRDNAGNLVTYLGDPLTETEVVGSPCEGAPTVVNVFSIENMDISFDGAGNEVRVDIGGPLGQEWKIVQNLFGVQGKSYTGPVTTPLLVTRSTYARGEGIAGIGGQEGTRIEVFAESTTDASVTFEGPGAEFVAVMRNVPGSTNRYFGTHFIDANTAAPFDLNSIVVKAVHLGTTLTNASGPNNKTADLVDQVSISSAKFDLNSQTLTATAASSDKGETILIGTVATLVEVPVLTVVDPLNNNTDEVMVDGTYTSPFGLVAPPSKVRVKSSAGGFVELPVALFRNPLATPQSQPIDTLPTVALKLVKADGIELLPADVFVSPAYLTLDGTESTDEGAIVSVNWNIADITSGTPALLDTSSLTGLKHVFAFETVAGSAEQRIFSVSLTATDDQGGSADSDIFTVTVNAPAPDQAAGSLDRPIAFFRSDKDQWRITGSATADPGTVVTFSTPSKEVDANLNPLPDVVLGSTFVDTQGFYDWREEGVILPAGHAPANGDEIKVTMEIVGFDNPFTNTDLDGLEVK